MQPSPHTVRETVLEPHFAQTGCLCAGYNRTRWLSRDSQTMRVALPTTQQQPLHTCRARNTLQNLPLKTRPISATGRLRRPIDVAISSPLWVALQTLLYPGEMPGRKDVCVCCAVFEIAAFGDW
jgi:hypothetical protein